MRRLDVIALDEAFEQDLPVDLELALGRREQALIRRDQPGEPVQRIVAQRRRVLGDEHEPQALARRHRNQRMRLLVEARESPPRAGCGAAGLRDCRSSRDSGRRTRARSRCRSPPACRDAGRRCGRRAPCRRRRAPRRSACRPLRGRRTSPPRAAPPKGRTASASAAACARSPRRAAPSIGSSRPARATPLGRHRSCRWRCDRARAAPRIDRPLPPSFCIPCRVLQAYARIRPTKKPRQSCMSLLQPLFCSATCTMPASRSACVARMQHA